MQGAAWQPADKGTFNEAKSVHNPKGENLGIAHDALHIFM